MSDIVKTKTENPDVRAYIYKKMPHEMNKNPLFVKVFGKDFARKRLKSMLLVAYTNEPTGLMRAAGYQDKTDKSITLCKSGKDGQLLTPTDIENNPELKQTTLHECIHAVLTRTKEECEELNIEYGTGLLQRMLVPGTSIVYEIGRGLNEGYTEWMTEKMGHKLHSYAALTNFVRLLEAARGTENIMALGTGHFCEALDMEKDEVNTILSVADSVYKTEDKSAMYADIANSLDYNDEFLSEEGREERKSKYSEYRPQIEDLRADIAFIAWAKVNHKDLSNNSLQEYINNVKIPEINESRDILVARFESIVIEKYFIKDLNEVFDAEHVNEDNLKKIGKIVSFLGSNDISSKSRDLCNGMTSVNVIKKYKELKKRFIRQVAKEDAEKYNNGNLPLRECVRRIKPYIKESSNDRVDYIETLVENVDYKHRKPLRDMLYAGIEADEDDKIFETATEAEIYSLISDEIYGECLVTSELYKPGFLFDKYKSEQVVDKNSDEHFRFDYTADPGEDLQKVVNQFEELRANVFKEHPNASIHIAQRTIVIDIDGNPTFYYVLDDNIVKMNIKQVEKSNCTPGEKEPKPEQSLVPVDIKSSRAANFINKIKRKWHMMRSKKEAQVPVNYVGDIPGKISLEVRQRGNFSFDGIQNIGEDLAKRINEENTQGIRNAQTRQQDSSSDMDR